MGRAADSLERTRRALEPQPRPVRGPDSEFSRGRFGETGSGTELSLRNVASGSRATRDLPFGADRDGLEHAQAVTDKLEIRRVKLETRNQKLEIRKAKSGQTRSLDCARDDNAVKRGTMYRAP